MGAARSAAESIIADYEGYEFTSEYKGEGSCYVEFGEGKVGRADVDFFSKSRPTGIHKGVSKALSDEKRALEEHNKAFWFGKLE